MCEQHHHLSEAVTDTCVCSTRRSNSNCAYRTPDIVAVAVPACLLVVSGLLNVTATLDV